MYGLVSCPLLKGRRAPSCGAPYSYGSLVCPHAPGFLPYFRALSCRVGVEQKVVEVEKLVEVERAVPVEKVKEVPVIVEKVVSWCRGLVTM